MNVREAFGGSIKKVNDWEARGGSIKKKYSPAARVEVVPCKAPFFLRKNTFPRRNHAGSYHGYHGNAQKVVIIVNRFIILNPGQGKGVPLEQLILSSFA